MPKRQNTFLIKRSNVPGKVPLPGDLQLGELALNTADVKLYTSGTTENDIIQIGWDKISRTGDTVTGDFVFNGDVNATSLSATTYQNLPFNISGSTNSIPVFTSSNVLSNSVIFQSSSNVGIGTTTPSAKLHIAGTGDTSATTALRLENSNGTASIQVTDHGLLQHTSNSETIITAPTEVYRFAASSGNTFKMMYTVQDSFNIRGGEYLCVHDGTDVNTIHTFPTEFGDTSGINFTLTITSDDIIIIADVTSGSWNIKLSVQIL